MTDHAAPIRDVLKGRLGTHEAVVLALDSLAALEQELDALADVAAAGNKREKRLEQELARLKDAARWLLSNERGGRGEPQARRLLEKALGDDTP